MTMIVDAQNGVSKVPGPTVMFTGVQAVVLFLPLMACQ